MSLFTAARKLLFDNPALPASTPLVSVAATALAHPDGTIALEAKQMVLLGRMLPFTVSGTLTKAVAATGAIVFTGLPTEGQTVTIDDGVNPAVVFEADSGTAATATITLTGVPADTGTVSLSDGTTSKVLEFDTGILGVASTGGILTIAGVPADGDTVTLTTHAGTATVYEFNTGAGVTGSNKAVFVGASAAGAATELIAAINATGVYAGNGSTGYTASSGGSGVVNLVRTATGAANQTITKSGAAITVTASFSGGVTQVAVGSAITGGRLGVGTAATPGGTALTTAQVCTGIINAINGVTGPAFLFTASQGAGTTVTLTAATKGTAGNSFTITESATNLTVSGAGTFTGGDEPGDGDITGDVGFAIGATAALTATALYNAINGASLDITATNGTAGTVGLTNDLHGSIGNVAIASTLSHATVAGMSGGADTEDAILLSDAQVGAGNRVIVTGFTMYLDGSTAWNEAGVLIADTLTARTFADVDKGLLVNGGVVLPTDDTVYTAFATGGDAGKGLMATTNGTNELTGSDVVVRVSGFIVPA